MAIHAEELRRFLSETTGRPVRLRMNDNLHSLITTTRDGTGPGIRLSLHRMFLQADQSVISALAQFITAPTPDARRVIRCFINENRELIVSARGYSAPRRVKGSAQGTHFNLDARATALNQHYFESKLNFGIIWGRGTRGGRLQHHVTLGTWNERQQLIRIHPMLDNPHVPGFYLDYVIYHEMVHVAVPSQVESGRLMHHTDEFYALEQRYAHYLQAQRWERNWLRCLIRAWHGGNPLPSQAASP
jgi:hypothetical protein